MRARSRFKLWESPGFSQERPPFSLETKWLLQRRVRSAIARASCVCAVRVAAKKAITTSSRCQTSMLYSHPSLRGQSCAKSLMPEDSAKRKGHSFMCRLVPRGCNVVLSVPALRCTRVLSARSCQRQGRRDGICSLGHKLRKPQPLMFFFFRIKTFGRPIRKNRNPMTRFIFNASRTLSL